MFLPIGLGDTEKMSEKVKDIMPLSMLLIGGKDSYAEIYKRVYGVSPKINLPQTPIKNKAETSYKL